MWRAKITPRISLTSGSHVSPVDGAHGCTGQSMVQRIDVVADSGHALRDGHVGEGQQAIPPAQPPTTLVQTSQSYKGGILCIIR
jgi:hypothetical protein